MRAFSFGPHMTQVPSSILQRLSEVLAAQSPQYASRLKQRLSAALATNGEDPFDERKYGFKGFRDFLKRGTQNLFRLEDSESGADVLVSLPRPEKSSSTAVEPAATGSIRSDIWQAFTNPDITRARYLNRRTFVVRHFLRGDASPQAKEVEGTPDDFVEIPPITGEVQVGWMQQFMTDSKVEEPLLGVLKEIVSNPYSSGVNAAFTGALGPLAAAWRQRRVQSVISTVFEWAQSHGVPQDKLISRAQAGQDSVSAPGIRSASKVGADVSSGDGIRDPREQAARLLDMLSNDDINRIVIPILLSTLLVRGRNN